ncbi:hypothetical protein ACHAXT_000921 [Thalassiosira profunda]
MKNRSAACEGASAMAHCAAENCTRPQALMNGQSAMNGGDSVRGDVARLAVGEGADASSDCNGASARASRATVQEPSSSPATPRRSRTSTMTSRRSQHMRILAPLLLAAQLLASSAQNPSQCSCSPRAFTFKLDLSASCPPLPPPFPPNAVFGAGVKDYTCSIGPEPLPSAPQQITSEDSPMVQADAEAEVGEAPESPPERKARRKLPETAFDYFPELRSLPTKAEADAAPEISSDPNTLRDVFPEAFEVSTAQLEEDIVTLQWDSSQLNPASLVPDGDVVPVSIYSIQFLEVDSGFNVINQDSTYVRGIDFVSGDTFSYDSIAGTDGAIPGGMNMVLRGVNAAGEPIRNVFTITYTNDCGVPTFSEGESIGWVIFESFEPATEATCGKATAKPTQNPASTPPPTKRPTATPRPSKKPSGGGSYDYDIPTHWHSAKAGKSAKSSKGSKSKSGKSSKGAGWGGSSKHDGHHDNAWHGMEAAYRTDSRSKRKNEPLRNLKKADKARELLKEIDLDEGGTQWGRRRNLRR